MNTRPNPTPWFAADRKEPQFYQGLRIMSDTNLHEQLAAMIVELLPPTAPADRRPKVLDLGCGEGAMAQRLCDLGYDVLAVDVDQEKFRAKGPQFVALDLNDREAVRAFAEEQAGRFDLVLAAEIIEHLRCPSDFIAACRRLCGPMSELLITTPNVSSWWGRFWFLLSGELWGFQPESWQDPGHRHPITVAEMQGLLRENGLACVKISPAGSLPVLWAYNFKRLAASLLMLPLRLVMRGEKDGWVLCYHARIAS